MPCLSTEELAALYDCVLTRQRADKLRDHVAACPRCAAEIALLDRMLDCREDQTEPGPEWIQRAVEGSQRGLDRKIAPSDSPAGVTPEAPRAPAPRSK